jgi:bla regulator protein BlaR1
MPRLGIGVCLLMLNWTGLGFAQSQQFEVVSIKPADPNARGSSFRIVPGGGIVVTNISARSLISTAYDVRDFQILSAPGWAGSERFDISAKSEHSETPSDPRHMADDQRSAMARQMRERLKALLAERFQLAVHMESKELPIYVLVQAKGGSKMEVSTEDSTANQSMSANRGQMTGRRITMQMLAANLSGNLGRPVRDETGLTATYNFKLEWSQETISKPGAPDNPDAETPTGPSIFTAMQEQLGLKLESRKGPVEVIVVDRLERPSAN